MKTYLTPWTVGHLVEAMHRDLIQCQSVSEKINCNAMSRLGIKEFVQNLTRKLTPGEQAMLDDLGIATKSKGEA